MLLRLLPSRQSVGWPACWLVVLLSLSAGCISRSSAVDDEGHPQRPPFAAVVDDPGAAASTQEYRPSVSIAGRRYSSLAAAVIAARDGDVLQLEPGLHGGPVELRASLVLEPSASLGEVTIHSRSASCLRVRGDVAVTVRGITLRADGNHGPGRDAAVTVHGGALTLEYCHVGSRANCAVQVLEGSLRLEQCSVLVEHWQSAVMVGDGSSAWLTDCRIENREQTGTALEVWDSQAWVIGGRLRASGAAVVAGEGGVVDVDEARLIDGGAAALALGTLQLDRCELVGSERAALRCSGVASLTRCRLLQHALGLLLSGEQARLTVSELRLAQVDELVAYENGATEEQLTIDESVNPSAGPPGGS